MTGDILGPFPVLIQPPGTELLRYRPYLGRLAMPKRVARGGSAKSLPFEALLMRTGCGPELDLSCTGCVPFAYLSRSFVVQKRGAGGDSARCGKIASG